jgi:ABC-2 type transport system permease protein
MDDLLSLTWIELRKALRSRMPLWTALGSLFMPLGIAFLIFVARNPQVSQQLGLVSAKADIVAFAATDWPAYLRLYGEMIGAGGLILFTLILSWIFGREFADGTLKDLLAVPVRRASIVLAKYCLAALWAAGMAIVIFLAGLVTGALLHLPGGESRVLLEGTAVAAAASGLAILVTLPVALFASLGRGYLLPFGAAILLMLAANLVQVLGWGEYFPWAVPALFAQGSVPLPAASYWIALLTGLAGVTGTALWWTYADQ